MQHGHKTAARYFTAFGETHTLTEWAALRGINRTTLDGRLRSGHFTLEQALSTPKITAPYRKHGATGTPEYYIWKAMKGRCNNPLDKNFQNYGGRGICISERWNASFESFLSDMGPKPTPGHSLDRIDNNGNYEPANCRWATRLEQNNNKRTNHLIEFDGQTVTIAEACRIAGNVVDPAHAAQRIRSGWDVSEAVRRPAGTRGKRIKNKKPVLNAPAPASADQFVVVGDHDPEPRRAA